MKKLMTVGCAALTALAGLMEAPAETLGFWAFNDGAAGTEVSTVANSAGSGTFAGTAAKTTTTGSLPTFSADSPGRIVSSSRAETVLCETSQSVAFRYPSRTNRQSGLIDLDGVADALVGKGSFTIEWFVKMDETYAYWQDGDGNYDQSSSLPRPRAFLRRNRPRDANAAHCRADPEGAGTRTRRIRDLQFRQVGAGDARLPCARADAPDGSRANAREAGQFAEIEHGKT